MVCADERWDGINIQHIRSIVENVKDKMVQVRIEQAQMTDVFRRVVEESQAVT